MQQVSHGLTLEDLQQSRLRQQQATVLGFELRTLFAALEEQGHMRCDPTSPATGKVLAYPPGPLIGQALALRALRLDLRLRQKPLPLTPRISRVLRMGARPQCLRWGRKSRKKTVTGKSTAPLR